MTNVVEYRKCKTLSSNPSAARRKKKRGKNNKSTNSKWAKKKKFKHFVKQNIQIANKYMKKYLTLLGVVMHP
jgi:hypothetical protein